MKDECISRRRRGRKARALPSRRLSTKALAGKALAARAPVVSGAAVEGAVTCAPPAAVEMGTGTGRTHCPKGQYAGMARPKWPAETCEFEKLPKIPAISPFSRVGFRAVADGGGPVVVALPLSIMFANGAMHPADILHNL